MASAAQYGGDRVVHFLQNFWYIAGFSHDIGHELVGRTILGKRVLIYRREDGVAVALEDRCIHRGLSLSSGKRLSGDRVQCGYHGIEFDSEGRCVNIPGQKHIPGKRSIKSYPVVERDGFVWIWAGDGPAVDPGEQIPDFSQWCTPQYWRAFRQTYERANGAFGVENALDMSHICYVHHKSFTDDVVTDFPIDLRVEGDVVTIQRSEFNIPAPPLLREVMGLTGNTDRTQRVRWSPPYHILLHSMVRPTGSTDPSETRNMYIYAGTTPETVRTGHGFGQIFRDYLVDNKEVSEYFDQQLWAALDEDIAIIEEQQRNWDQDGPDSPMINTSLDGSSMSARRILARLFREQNGGIDVPMPWCHLHRLTETQGVVERSRMAEVNAGATEFQQVA